MLQQTQVSRVEQKYPEFIRRFPTLRSLARARSADVIRAWAGMGYNNRALYLHLTAKRIVHEHHSRFPRDINVLQQLPGIGRYTAGAVACFAFGEQRAVVDTNVRRVLSRLFPLQSNSMTDWELAEWILPPKKAFDWNQVLMELGGLICTSRNPQCSLCPVQRHCKSAFTLQNVQRIVQKTDRKVIPDRIYRGRIVAILRMLAHGRSIDARQLVKQIKPEFRSSEKKWFASLLRGLSEDGLIHIRHRQGKIIISLPV
jgi:A/G-specific adenine glycosylase